LTGLRAKGSGLADAAPALSPKPTALSLRPLLKWAGGKRQLLPQLRRFYPPLFNRYLEPFFGSGAVFFDLYGAGRLGDRDVVLIDSNADLIGCYETVRTQRDEVARELDRLAAAHARDGQAQYYAVRAIGCAAATGASPTRRSSRRCSSI
jgi:DNA adenine methylase